ncbi:hypothetical protein BN1708_019710, partial [Verticillium longisporum]
DLWHPRRARARQLPARCRRRSLHPSARPPVL